MRQPLGQHFLRDLKVVKTIVAAAELKPKDVTLEIGPGRGVLTGELLGRGGALDRHRAGSKRWRENSKSASKAANVSSWFRKIF